MKLVLLAWRVSRVTLLFALVTALLSGITSVAAIGAIQTSLRLSTPTHARALGFVGLVLVLCITRALSQAAMLRLPLHLSHRLHVDLASKILDTPLDELEKLGSSRLLSVFTNDIGLVVGGISALPAVLIAVATVVVSGGYLLWLSPRVFVPTLGIVAMAGLSYSRTRVRAAQSGAAWGSAQVVLLEQLRALLGGTKELKLGADRRRLFLGESLAPASRDVGVALARFRSRLATAALVVDALFQVLLGVVVFGLPLLLTGFDLRAEAGAVLVLLFLIAQTNVIGTTIPGVSHGITSLRRLDEMGLILSATESSGGTPPSTATCRKIQLRGVVRAYRHERDDSRFELGPIDLVLEPATLCFVIGGNGSGKSTLVKLLTGLYVPEAGSVLWDDRPVEEATREAYRQLFSTVFADYYLFDRIHTQGRDAEARVYVEKLQLQHKVKIENGMFSTTALSTGQRKRLALLSAYLEDRPVYVFDEWASDQDPVFKHVFYTELLPELKQRGKLVIVVTHDDRYFHIADQIVKLEDGKLVTQDKST